MNFKIIALEVLDSCESQHSKNLIKGIPYVFYKNYKIKRENGNEIIELVSKDFDLYSKDREPKINISAIVGKNGSGKSTLVELLIKAVNNLFFKYREQYSDRNFHSVEIVKEVEVNLYYKTDEGIFKLYIFPEKLYIFQDVDRTNYKVYQYEEISNNYKKPKEVTSLFKLKNFFYTEVINYSLYSYNSNQEGDWINQIFHKNDGYQTPIVLNPWREEGIIDINKENALVYQRLLANLLRYDAYKKLNLSLGDNLEASILLLELSNSEDYIDKSKKDFKVDLSVFDDDDLNEILNSLFKEFYGEIPEIKIEKSVLELSKLYILYKLISICHKYEEYRNGKYFDETTKIFIDLKGLIQRLKKDNSHIIFKLRQTLNYLKYNHITFNTYKSINKLSFKTTADEVRKVAELENCNLINCLPPPLFRTDILLDSNRPTKKEIKFSTLSSGEKQQIYSTSSIYYHLMNLDSIKNSTDTEKISYGYINVILEEIELYFHPEYQRTFVNRLLEGIKKLNLENIKGINLIFVTHSPFILSDIPNSNIMYLKINSEGKSENIEDKKKSFASNIHHLLGDRFFLENVSIGELARNKIDEILSFIKKKRNKDIEYYYGLINLIDEPILKNKLTEMLFENFPHFAKQKNREEKEQKVRNFAKQLGIDINITRST